jgi:murein DD-endopeptidase MepM/ murein hydrolase activator NlpD
MLLAMLLGRDTHDYEADARALLASILSNDFAAATRNFNETMMGALGPEKLAEVYKTQIAPQLGAFESAGKATTANESGITIITIAAKFEKAPISFVVAYDAAGKVAGLWFRPQSPEPAPTRFADYQTKTNLRLPFDGEWYVFWGGRTMDQNYHVIAKDQRFAYDLVIKRKGFTYSGSPKSNANYFCWDQPIYAPAAGIVTESVDGIDDNIPGAMNPSTPAGNHLVIDHGNGEYSLLAHFRKGTVVPKVGDRVKQGDVIGHCGNSGNSSEPHLHYHLQNAPKFGTGEGLPAQFTNYTANGKKVERGEPVKGERISRQ